MRSARQQLQSHRGAADRFTRQLVVMSFKRTFIQPTGMYSMPV